MEKLKRGRPKKFVDLELVEKLAHIQCTYPEVAATLGLSVDTLLRNKDFATTYKRGAEGGRKSLRRMQFESANKGNIAMQIFLGKQYLGQSDHVVNEVRRLPSLRDMTTEELRQAIDEYMSAFPELAAEVRAEQATIDARYAVVPPELPAAKRTDGDQ
jgi:hypothetical protein